MIRVDQRSGYRADGPRPYAPGPVLRLARAAVAAVLAATLGLAAAPVQAADRPVPAPRERRFLLGIEGVGVMAPALRPRITSIDGRYLGGSVTLGGVGVVGRFQAVPRIGLELGVRSGSLRYRNKADVISQDMVMAELGVLLYVLRGKVGHFAVDAGGGGMVHAIRYELAGRPSGTQLVGAGLVHIGADLELRLRRIAFTASLRALGVVTDVARTRTGGALFTGASEALRRAPVAVFQTYLLGSVGIAYRF